jgi:hypothetical protein
MNFRTTALALVAALTAGAAAAQSAADLDALSRIRDEGFRRSQVMDLAAHLTDAIGPRLTGSPQMKVANDWAKAKLAEWGLANARNEPYEFGEGWTFTRSDVRMVAPVPAVLSALPKAWTPGTAGRVRGVAMNAKFEKAEDLDALAGKLAGKILMMEETSEPRRPEGFESERWTDEELAELEEYDIPAERDREAFRERRRKQRELWAAIADRLVAEGVVALVEGSSFLHGAVRTGGHASQGMSGVPLGPPQLAMAREGYERIVRLLDDGAEVELELDVETAFHRESSLAWNTLADIPSRSGSNEVVMVGAHLDSWHLGTGATDNAAGSAIVLEAMRILKAIGIKPKRTIRAALWSGEEQGLLGSRAYVEEHFATRPAPTDPAEAAVPKRWQRTTWPITTKPEHRNFALYFNLDNGGGRVRGIYAQENLGAKLRMERWIAPLADLGVKTVTMENTSATDHISFDSVGLPGFQLVQDSRDYAFRTHHSNLDTYERLDKDDLRQAAVVVASLVYQAAMDEAPFPRKPLPTEPPKRVEKKPAGEVKPAAPKPAEPAAQTN